MDRKVAIQLRNNEPWEKMSKMMSEAGFKYVAMSFGDDEGNLLKEDWKDYVYKMKSVFDKNDLKCVMTHAPYYPLLISAEERDEKLELTMLRTIEATKILDADICAVHPRSFIDKNLPERESVDRERSLIENIKSFKPLVQECEKFGVKLGIENLMKYPNAYPPFYSYIVDDQIELIEKLNSKNVCAVWDFGHANLCEEDQAERIRKLGSKIMGTHIHNNDGINDNHFPPFYPQQSSYYVRKSVDWNSVMSALKDTNFDGYLTLEIVFHFDYSLNALIKYLYDNVCELENLLKE